MSELTNARDDNGRFRRHLLANVSVLALLGYVCNAASADTDRPTLWIELGGQLERVEGGQSIFSPPFFDKAPPTDLALMSDAQRPPNFSIGGEGKISFIPEGTDWVFSVAVRYGRSNGGKRLHHETQLGPVTGTFFGQPLSNIPNKQLFADAQTNLHESHAILDFQAGKDLGLGMFGGSSIISAGVRFAQFVSKSDVTLHARPVYGFNPTIVSVPGKYKLHSPFRQTYTAIAHHEHSLRAIGPSLSWDASAPVIGGAQGSQFTFDWGLNGAILFGRQHVQGHHQTTGYNYFASHPFKVALHEYQYVHTHSYVHPANPDRSRSVVVPNVGGFAGVSLKFPNAKVSLGYRADFFFGAMDGGVDVAKKENVGFYGPFASVSIGIGG